MRLQMAGDDISDDSERRTRNLGFLEKSYSTAEFAERAEKKWAF